MSIAEETIWIKKQNETISGLIKGKNNVLITIGLNETLPTVFISHAHKDLAEGRLDDILGYLIRYCRIIIYIDENDEEPRNTENRKFLEQFLSRKMDESDKAIIMYSKAVKKSRWCEFEYDYLRGNFNGMKAVYNVSSELNSHNIICLKRYMNCFDVIKDGVDKSVKYIVCCKNRKVYCKKKEGIQLSTWCES